MHNSTKLFGVIVVAAAGLAANGGTAFTASNTTIAADAHIGGYSTANVTGASVSDITYTYSADRSKVNSITFTLARDLPARAVAEVQTGDSATAWKSCSITAAAATPASILCTVTAATADITHLTLVVRDGGTHLTSS